MDQEREEERIDGEIIGDDDLKLSLSPPRGGPRRNSPPGPLSPPLLLSTEPLAIFDRLLPSGRLIPQAERYRSDSLAPAASVPRPTSEQPRNRNAGLREPKPDLDQPPYAWATTKRAIVHSLDYLVSRNILVISGQVQCKRCERTYEIEYDLRQKFNEVGSFVAENNFRMRQRAPEEWSSPIFPKCMHCGAEKSAKPCISTKKRSINWLFLLLGQTIGCCTLEQLKYFCKHNEKHRTGAKDRVLYLTYLTMCKQLDPAGPFSPR